MNVSVVIATCGHPDWADLAWSRAYPSANAQEPRPEIVIEHYPELGVSASRNAAARNASGEALIFLDADDELCPGYIAAMEPLLRPTGIIHLNPSFFDADDVRRALAKECEGRQAPMVVTTPPDIKIIAPPALGVPALCRVFADGRMVGPEIPNRGRWPEVNECVVGTLVSTELFWSVGGFRDLPIYEDWDLFLRCFDAGAQLVYVEDAVYCEHVNPTGRNSGPSSAYDSIWADHLARIRA